MPLFLVYPKCKKYMMRSFTILILIGEDPHVEVSSNSVLSTSIIVFFTIHLISFDNQGYISMNTIFRIINFFCHLIGSFRDDSYNGPFFHVLNT